MILAIRTDRPEAELYLIERNEQVNSIKWLADRQLADTILSKIDDFLTSQKLNYSDLKGVIAFTGEGSFTGLRIGTTVANTIAYAQKIPIVSAAGEDWLASGSANLDSAKPNQFVKPIYSRKPNITKPK